eukprot:1471371-Amphidinium_carterae.1
MFWSSLATNSPVLYVCETRTFWPKPRAFHLKSSGPENSEQSGKHVIIVEDTFGQLPKSGNRPKSFISTHVAA